MVLTGSPALLGLVAVMYLFHIFAVLSGKLGQVTKMKPYYRGLYAGLVLMGVAVVSHVLKVAVVMDPESLPGLFKSDAFYLLTYYVPVAVATTVSLLIVWHYWKWLFRERLP